jgi:DNA-binding HxlR family transcriptional regulator
MKHKSENIEHDWNKESDDDRSEVFGARYRIRTLLRKNKTMRFTDLQREMKLSNNVLSKHLKKMKGEGKILSKKEGREVYYTLSENKSLFPEILIPSFYESMNEYVEESMVATASTDKQFLEKLSQKLSSLLLFSIFNSVRSGEDSVKYFKFDELVRYVLYTMFQYMYKEKVPNSLLFSIENYPNPVNYNELCLDLYDDDDSRLRFKRMLETFEKLYRDDVKVMKYLYEDPFSRSWMTVQSNSFRDQTMSAKSKN